MSILKPDYTGLLRESRGSLYCYWGLAFLMATLYALLSYLTPLYLDDWIFMAVWRDDVDGGYEFSWRTWADYFLYIRGFDNGRIANALSPISTMFSPWKEIFPILTGICVAISAVLVQRFATGRRSIFALSITWILMIVGLPWIDTMFVRDYSLNYLWASAVTLIFLWFLRAVCHGRKLLAPSILLALIAGGWHEGFASATLCGLALLAIIRKFRMPWNFYALVCVYLLSDLLFMLSPGLIRRAAEVVTTNDHSVVHLRIAAIIILDLFLAVVLIILSITGKSRKQRLKRLQSVFCAPSIIVSIGIIAGGFAIGFLSTNTLRSFFWPDLAAVMLAVRFIVEICKMADLSRLAFRLGSIMIIAACIAQTIYATVWQARYKRETDEIMALLDKSATGTVFYDIKLPASAPRLTMGIPVSNAWHNEFHYRLLWSYYMTPVIGVVPTAMRNATAAETEPDTIGLTMPDYIDGKLKIPFISEKGDTLIYNLCL